MKSNRRRFLQAAAVVAAGGVARPGRGSRERPNVLIVLDDQERSPMHLPPLSLPHRERLKPTAVEFTQVFCSYPLCSPSRASLLTGRWPHEVGVLTNVDFAGRNPSLSPQIPNLASVFQAGGYHTAYFGKWHLTRKYSTSAPLHDYGFQEAQISNQLLGLGSDDRLTRHAVRFLEKSKDRSPWLMIFAPVNPHDICFPQLDPLYGGKRDYPVQLPPNFEASKAPAIKSFREFRDFWWVERAWPKSEAEWRRYLKFYCYLVEHVDKNLGQILDALAESGQGENTIVVFTSDHGEMGGSHGLIHKCQTMYEENLRVPLWISDPRQVRGFRQCPALVTNLDLPLTLARLAGLAWPTSLPGLDLSPILAGEEDLSREEIFAEGSMRAQVFWRGIRTREWKYWHYTNGEELLFHLATDPLEMKNLAGDPEAKDLLLRFREKVRAWRKATADPIRDFLD